MEACTNREQLMDNLRERYQKVRDLLSLPAEAKLPSGEIPLSQKNEAVDVLKGMQVKLEDALNTTEGGDESLSEMLAVICLDIGIICVENDELTTGEEYLMRSTNMLSGKEVTPRGILASISALNQLGLISFQWSKSSEAEEFLKKAERFYKEYVDSKNGSPVAMASLFGIVNDEKPDAKEVLDKLYTLTLYYLAQIYGVTKEHYKSAQYCHMTLQRQLNQSDLDPIDWALNAATLAQFFMEKQHFHQARHHLAAATHILSKYESSLGQMPKEEGEEVVDAMWERYKHRSSDVARCWAKYGIVLMNTSRERLIELSENSESEKGANDDCSELDLIEKESLLSNKMIFDDLTKEIEVITNRVTDKYLLDFNDARSVFLDVQTWLDEAQKYYTFETHASDYVQIVQDKSQAFKALTFFEDDEERQAKMHKRRINLLVPVVEQLNPRYYHSECRQIWIELAETFSAMLTIKLDKLQADDNRPNPHALSKINSLAQSSIEYYQKFLDSLKESENSPPVQKFSDDMVRPALYAYFHLGTLYNKIITPDKNVQLENVRKSFEAYKFFVDYCEPSPELSESMKLELVVCKDLVKLLPLKISKLMQAISSK